VQIFTIGHSNLPFDEFLSLLKEFEIRVVADIRRYPGSRKFPHFNQEIMRGLLEAEGIEYVWFEGLGGRRGAEKNSKSPNTALRSTAFRNYADYMGTNEFRESVRELMSRAGTSRTAIMCAEKLFWRCHRRLLSDYLVAQGVEVKHIVEAGKLQPHSLSSGAVIIADREVIYPLQKTGDKPDSETFLFER
jgi:uncharacterized protein (DUF488 family)